MSKIVVTQAKFDEAVALYGLEMARSVMVAEGRCGHDWRIQTTSGCNSFVNLVYATSFLKCEDCGEEKNHLNLLGNK